MAAEAGEGVRQLRVDRFFRQVPDFKRDGDGNVVWSSLKGPARLEAQEQFTREQFVAIEEAKMLRQAVRECYHREGVNHLENCKDIVKQYVEKISKPNFGMLKVRRLACGLACGAVGRRWAEMWLKACCSCAIGCCEACVVLQARPTTCYVRASWLVTLHWSLCCLLLCRAPPSHKPVERGMCVNGRSMQGAGCRVCSLYRA